MRSHSKRNNDSASQKADGSQSMSRISKGIYVASIIALHFLMKKSGC